jgi:type I restriction enzyme S subunit
MHTSRVNPAQVDTKRLDPDYYYPEHLETERILKSLKSVPLRQVGTFWAGPFGSELPSSLYLNEGVPLFRVGNVGRMQVLYDGMAYLDPAVHQQLSASEVRPGDLLVVKASVGEKICRIPVSIPKANITQHIIAIRPNGKADPDYLSAFLFGRYGRSQLVRRSLGSIIQYLGVNDARTVLYPPIDRTAQTFIGDKIRQAERLRDVGASALNEATSLLEECLRWESKLAKSSRFRRLKAVELADRLDGNFNSPARLSMMDHLDRHGIRRDQLSPKLADVSAMVGWKGLTTEHYTDSGPWLLRGVEIVDGVIDFDALISVAQDKYDEQPQIHLQKGDVALSKDGTIGKAAVIPDLPQEMAVGSTVARLRLRDNSGIDPYYLEHALNHDVLQIQIRSFATGMAQPHITQEWIERLQVPRCVNENRIASLVKRHHTATTIAKDLTLVARFLVEALIERRVSESDLITLQKALEGGDSQGERFLLSRMTRKGLDVKGAPVMFPNLDGLYQILTETEPLVTAEAK